MGEGRPKNRTYFSTIRNQIPAINLNIENNHVIKSTFDDILPRKVYV